MKLFFVLTLLLTSYSRIHSQDFSFGSISEKEKNIEKKTLDSFSNAIVLNEYGNARMFFDDVDGRMMIRFLYHVKIKILNQNTSRHANIVIPIYNNDNSTERIENVKASSFNMKNGSIAETPVDSKSFYHEAYNKNVELLKFTFPDIHDNTIIEYTYEKTSPRVFNFQNWDFQDDIPKIRSEFEAIIPANYSYNVILRGYYKLTNTKSKLLNEDVNIHGWKLNSSDMTYIMENIPAFIEEDYMTAASNFKSAIYYELSDVMQPSGAIIKYTKSWKDVEHTLWDDRNFGKQLRENTYKNIIPTIIAGKQDNLSKAKAIYQYIQKQIKWNKRLGIFSESTIDDALKKHSGNVADVNISLINALNEAKIQSEAFILSTRQNGVPNKLNPVLSDFNYIIAKATIDGNSYLLDATDPNLGFGIIPMRCLNDSGRVMPYKKDSYWDAIAPSMRADKTLTMNAKLEPDGRLIGKIQIKSLEYEAYKRRTLIKEYSNLDDFVDKHLIPSFGKFKVKDYTITGVDSSDEDIVEEYNFELKLFEGLSYSKLSFNPFLLDKITKNPFNLNDRNYPIDLGIKSTSSSKINIEVPSDFEIVSNPTNIHLVLPNKEAVFINSDKLDSNHHLNAEYIVQFNNTKFSPSDYSLLKEFFSRIIQLEKTDIVFKRKDK